MTQLADGDRTAFDGFYAALWPLVSAFCAKTLPPADAEDAAQVALLKVFEQATNFDRDKDAVSWAFAIASWEVRTIRQHHARSHTTQSDDADGIFAEKSPEGLLAEREIVEVARSVLGTLSESDQATLIATFNEDSTGSASGPALRKRRQRALFRLKQAWRSIYGN